MEGDSNSLRSRRKARHLHVKGPSLLQKRRGNSLPAAKKEKKVIDEKGGFFFPK